MSCCVSPKNLHPIFDENIFLWLHTHTCHQLYFAFKYIRHVRSDSDRYKDIFLSFQIFDKYCPDGLVFDETSIQFAKCSFPFSVNCEGRPELQPAKPTKFCPRQNGYFAHEDPTVCLK